MTFRLMGAGDIAAVLRVQAECYPAAMNETEQVIRDRLAASSLAWVAEDDAGVCGYLMTYLSTLGKVGPLGGAFAPAAAPDCLYLHDLAVSPRAAGRSIGPVLVRCAWDAAIAKKLPYSALVSVQDSRRFWEKLGYRVRELAAGPERDHLATYVGPAHYMVKEHPEG